MTAQEFAEKYAGQRVKIRIGHIITASTYRVIGWKNVLVVVELGTGSDITAQSWELMGFHLVVPGPTKQAAGLYRPESLLVDKAEVNRDRYPHKCQRKGCGKPAFVGFTLIDCSNPGCK